MRCLKRFFGVLRLLETDDGIAVGAATHDPDRGHLAVLLVVVKQAIL